MRYRCCIFVLKWSKLTLLFQLCYYTRHLWLQQMAISKFAKLIERRVFCSLQRIRAASGFAASHLFPIAPMRVEILIIFTLYNTTAQMHIVHTGKVLLRQHASELIYSDLEFHKPLISLYDKKCIRGKLLNSANMGLYNSESRSEGYNTNKAQILLLRYLTCLATADDGLLLHYPYYS